MVSLDVIQHQSIAAEAAPTKIRIAEGQLRMVSLDVVPQQGIAAEAAPTTVGERG
jgi:hypothetical protein